MTFNILATQDYQSLYQQGLLPQRNDRQLFYQESSCRSNLSQFTLSSENRRIIRKTTDFSFEKINLADFSFDLSTQKTIHHWIKNLGWDFPISSVKYIFNHHIFNQLFIWKLKDQIVGYAICYYHQKFSHIAYVFYNPDFAHQDLPIRMVIETIIDSANNNLDFCYLGRFDLDKKIGYYKRNLPGFEYYQNNHWQQL
ncbi:MAG TPA: hypothetical protein PK370_00180 [Candidatus Woesebacteria bacterium]|nr:hypothetical protein [Candidatus Woesebacteria bacterium]HPJ17047.1 hypothetical protein [Candidatus Woesebacteria bacterium]